MTGPRLLSDRYELGETLGFGGMSEVHLARDLRLHRDVAIKVLRSDLARDPSFYLRFRREAQNAAALNHPTIVSVYDTGEAATSDGPVPFIVMEYVDGETLRDALRRDEVIDPRQAMIWIADVAAALDFSHQNDIVHRDVKPANIMVDQSGAIKVMDFGIARMLTDNSANMTQTAAVIGTAQYLSPEQARGESVDRRSDVYSLGCVLFELVTGEPPFTGDSPVSVAYQHVREAPPIPSSLNSEIPAELDSIILKAMNKNPDNRYSTAGQMRADLIRVLSGNKPSAPVVLSDAERTDLINSIPSRAITEEQPQRATGKIVTTLATITALIIGAILLITKPWASDDSSTLDIVNSVAVPSVENMTLAQAKSELEALGFTIVSQNEASNSVDAGTAIRTSPASGSKVKAKGQITIFVSSGPRQISVPNVAGKSRDTALTSLIQAGFDETKINFTDVSSTEAEKGKVVGTLPKSGTRVESTRQITVQLGAGPSMVQVPDVIGQLFDRAKSNIENAKLQVKRINVDSNEPKGTVISTSPSAQTEVREGTTIEVNVSKGNSFVMPDLTGMSYSEAKQALIKAGWDSSAGSLNRVDRRVGLGDSNIGKVMAHTPRAGTEQNSDVLISLYIGKFSLL